MKRKRLTQAALAAALGCVAVTVATEVPASDEDWSPLRARIGLPPAYEPLFAHRLEGWANVAGGRRRGATLTGLLTFGAEVDTEAAGWWRGGRFHVTGLGLYGGNISREIGDAGIASNIAGVSTVRLFRAWYGQRWLDGRLDVKAGIVALDDDFMVLPAPQLFLNSGFGTAQTEALDTPAPIYPLGSLGARVALELHHDWVVKLGAYDGDAGDPTERNHVSDVALTNEGGAILLGEVLWRTAPGDRALTLGLGAFGHTGLVTDRGVPPRRRGLGSVYVMAEHELGGLGDSMLTGFAHGALALPDDRAVAVAYGDAGLVLDGGAWRRPHDRVGLGWAWTAFGAEATRARRATTRERVSVAEAVLELTYEAVIQPWLALQPATQWHRRPRLGGRDALVVALRVSSTF